MAISSKQLCEEFSELIAETIGEPKDADRLDRFEEYSENSLIFLNDEKAAESVLQKAPAVIVASPSVTEKIKNSVTSFIIVAHDIRLAQALIKQSLDDYDASDPEWPDTHPTAVIHESAQIGSNTRIGPNVVIGANVKIGDNAIIRSNSVIEHDSSIGDDCIIHSLVNVGSYCIIKNRVILRAGCIIGGEGFGFAQDKQKKYHRIPHTGNVVIEDDVQVGANCNIDRGTYGSTLIKQGTKIDAMCHIAHNVEVGENTILVAQNGIAGSSTVGNNVVISGQSAISDHVKVGDNTVLVHRAGVTEDITEPGMWAGTPAKPFREYIKTLNVDKKIDKLTQRMKQLEKKLSEQ